MIGTKREILPQITLKGRNLINTGQNSLYEKSICMHGLIKAGLIASELELLVSQWEL